MPVARILTRFPERTSALAEDLQHHGYTVEIQRPGEAGLSPADLEIDFEICNNEEALQRATELARQWSTDVAVSPGVGEFVPAAEPAMAAVDHQDDIVVIPPPAVQAMDRAEQPAVYEAAAAAPATVHNEAIPADITEQLPSPQMAEHESVPQPVEELDHVAGPVLYEVPDVVREPESVENAGQRHQFSAEEEPNGEPAQLQPDYAARARELSAAALNSAKAVTMNSGEWLRRKSEWVRQQIDLKRAEMQARREIRQEQQEKRKALAQQRAVELEAAREAAAVRLQELLRERGGLTESQPVPPQVQPVNEPKPERRAAAAGAGSFFKRHLGFSFYSGVSPQLEAVLMGVAAACALFVLGLAVASFHAGPAISKTVDVAQPYKGVTVQGGGVTLKPSAAAATTAPAHAAPANPGPVAGNPAARTSPAPRTASGKTSPSHAGNTSRIGNDVVIRRLDQPRSSASHTGGGSDVTIRQFGTNAKPAASNSTPAGPKRISDMD